MPRKAAARSAKKAAKKSKTSKKPPAAKKPAKPAKSAKSQKPDKKGVRPELEHVYAKDRAALRAWFVRHHKTKDSAFIVYYKKATKIPSVTYREALMEAICFGWIDTTVKSIDEERYGTTFVKRKPTANWSENTLRYAEELIKKRLMRAQGLAAYKLGKAKKPMESFPKDVPPPKDLLAALKKNKAAKAYFDKCPPSKRYICIVWVLRVKSPEKRAERITKLVKGLAKGQLPF